MNRYTHNIFLNCMSEQPQPKQQTANSNPNESKQDQSLSVPDQAPANPGPIKQQGGKQVTEWQFSQSSNFPVEMFICHLCKDLMVSTIQNICGHAFCEYCLFEYLLVSKQCPICGLVIRQKKGAANKRLDELIEEFCHYLGEQEKAHFKSRKEKRRILKEQRKMENGFAGEQVDIRDEDYIWRKGRIVRTFNRVNADQIRIKFVVVEYLGTEKKQELLLNSSRLAIPGHFSNRRDIPNLQIQRFENRQMPRLKDRRRQISHKIEDSAESAGKQKKEDQLKNDENLPLNHSE